MDGRETPREKTCCFTGHRSAKLPWGAKEKIRAACACPEADVFFISGGTQANAVVIGSMLHRWEGVLAATTGHVAAHEAGAIEFTGHKVIGLPHTNGKLDAGTVAQVHQRSVYALAFLAACRLPEESASP